MAESIKNILLSKITDEIMDLVIGLSKTEIENIINQSEQQKVLWHCIERFAASDYYKTEFRNTNYVPNKQLVISLDKNLINISLPLEQLKNNLAPTINFLFISDHNSRTNNKILDVIVSQYIIQAKATLQLYDLLKIQRDNFDSLDSSLDEIKKILGENEQKIRMLEAEKHKLIQAELSNEYSQILSRIMMLYLLLIHKKMPKIAGVSPDDSKSLLKGLFDKTQETVNEMEEYITSDFVMKPVLCPFAKDLNLCEIAISYFKYTEFYFKKETIEKTDILLSYQNWLDVESIVLILRLRNLLKGNMFVDIYQLGQGDIVENGQFVKIDVSFFRATLCSVGETIISLYKKLIE